MRFPVHMFRSPLHRCIISFAIAATLVPGFAAETTATGPIVELPKFVVTGKPVPTEAEAWRYAAIPGIEVLSNAPDRETQRILSNFQQFQNALKVASLIQDRSNTPLLFVFCRAPTAADLLLPGGRKLVNEPPQGVFVGRSRAAIVVGIGRNVDQTSIGIGSGLLARAQREIGESWRDAAASEARMNDSTAPEELDFRAADPVSENSDEELRAGHLDTDRQLPYLYMKYLLTQSDPPLPFWFQEGLMRIVADMEVQPDFVSIGDGRSFMAFFSPRSARMVPLIPFEEFFTIGEAELASARDDKTTAKVSIVTAQAWPQQAHAFAHLCLFGEGGKWKKPLSKLLVRAAKQPVTEALFKECFGMSFKEMGTHMRGYVTFVDSTRQEFRAKGAKPAAPAPVALREATDAEVGRIKGYALQLAGQVSQGRSEFIAAYHRGDRDPELLAGLGLIELENGKTERGYQFLKAAVAGKTRNPDAYVALARERMAAAAAAPGQDGRYSAEQTAEIVKLARSAVELPPTRAETCELLADVWARSAVSPAEDDVTLQIRAAIKYPGRLKLVYGAAVMSIDAKLYNEARTLVEHGIKFAPDPVTRLRFERLKALIPEATPAAGAVKG